MSRSNTAADFIDSIAHATADLVIERVADLIRNVQPRPTQDPPFLNQRELAEQLKVSGRTLEKWRSRGLGPPYRRVGKRTLYPSSGVARWLEDCGSTASPTNGRARRVAARDASEV